MKKFRFLFFGMAILLCITVIACFEMTASDESTSSVIDKIRAESITSIEVSGGYDGSKLKPRELTQAEIEELDTWITQLSLKHRTYAEGKTPNRIWNGGTSYNFNINDGETSFAWVYIDKAYIYYEGEWYEIKNTSEFPLDLSE